MRSVIRALILVVAMAGPAAAFDLELPIAYTPGIDCVIQQYVDHDPGPDVQDYACGTENP